MGHEASKRPQTVGEEIANAVSHGAALLASIALIPVLVTMALRRNDPWAVVETLCLLEDQSASQSGHSRNKNGLFSRHSYHSKQKMLEL